MHTGEPLFGGADQADQICRIIDILGLPPVHLLERATSKVRAQFFETVEVGSTAELPPECDPTRTLQSSDKKFVYVLKRPQSNREAPKPRSLADIVGVYTGGPSGRRREESGHTQDKYLEFLDFIE
jgi:dual specificity tyrosine-phosphorylation-regulated kinase 1